MDKTDCDVLIVGAGMGGSIVAGKCGDAGLSVIVLEKGAPPAPGPRRGRLARLFASQDDRGGERWPTETLFRPREGAKAKKVGSVLGIGPGGSGRIYGAALGRGERADFERDYQPGQWHETEETALRNDWPVSYDEFLPAYREAEQLLGVVGTLNPLDPDDDAMLGRPPAVSPAHHRIIEQLEANGQHPYRMHVGIAYRPGCSECQGSTCLRDCKAHGFNRALEPALRRTGKINLEYGLSVTRLEERTEGGWIVHASDQQGNPRKFSAANVVLAAGALNSPRVLLDSPEIWDGAVPEMLGRGLMFHASEIFAVSGPGLDDLYGPRKVIALRDHYFEGPAPLAECQSLGMVSAPGMIAHFLAEKLRRSGLNLGPLRRLVLRPVGEIAQRLFSKAELFTANLQDLPYPDNRVTTETGEDGTDRIAVTYRKRAELVARGKIFRKRMKEAFSPLKVRFLTGVGEPNLGHPMGTCRMGHEPKDSVTDAQGQVWNKPGLYVADASVFPGSLGLNPGLTVAAHALRVARSITQLRKTTP
ncbi:GMC oxidoreductase [Aurantiacibacter poecillastricola]|uniref:GMC oxidoreductase n=1 Tax=Aurantiacibacter poecillastricola TaxID=3064385 RepID=UPI00273FAF5C|nr:GMC family oxidoreductase [Aurantiacibacter sp. 219JJ12-13]MDP5260713.1 GMC family oxidoreductase [Aurantiacibacter sp. 219JJ12-13]